MTSVKQNEHATGRRGLASAFIMSLSLLPIMAATVLFFGAVDGFEMMRMTFTLGMATAVMTVGFAICMGVMKTRDDYVPEIIIGVLAIACFNLAYDPSLMGGVFIGLITLFFFYVVMMTMIILGVVSASKCPHDRLANAYHKALLIQVSIIQISVIPFAMLKYLI